MRLLHPILKIHRRKDNDQYDFKYLNIRVQTGRILKLNLKIYFCPVGWGRRIH